MVRGPKERINPSAREAFPIVRQLLAKGEIARAEELALEAMAGTPESQGHYLPLGELYIEFDHGDREIPWYLRTINHPDIARRFAPSAAIEDYPQPQLGTACAHTTYRAGEPPLYPGSLLSTRHRSLSSIYNAAFPSSLTAR